jgi:hypothetical protein
MLIDDVKLALRITTNVFDSELNILIDSAKLDLGIAGVDLPDEVDSICKIAIITYCKIHFGNPDNADRLQKSYDEQKAQLGMATGYTDWSE